MSEQHRNKSVIDNWLCNGGAEIVLAVLRRYGWKIETLMQDDWPYVEDVVVIGDREQETMEICGAKSPWQQAFFAALLADRHDPVNTAPRDFWYPMLRESDEFSKTDLRRCYDFIDEIRVSSEATVELMVNSRRGLPGGRDAG